MKSKVLFAAVLIGISLLTGCRRTSVLGEVGQCLELATKYSEDVLEFYNNETKGNCNAVRSSLQAYIKKCDLAKEDRDDLEEELDSTYDCSQYN